MQWLYLQLPLVVWVSYNSECELWHCIEVTHFGLLYPQSYFFPRKYPKTMKCRLPGKLTALPSSSPQQCRTILMLILLLHQSACQFLSIEQGSKVFELHGSNSLSIWGVNPLLSSRELCPMEVLSLICYSTLCCKSFLCMPMGTANRTRDSIKASPSPLPASQLVVGWLLTFLCPTRPHGSKPRYQTLIGKLPLTSGPRKAPGQIWIYLYWLHRICEILNLTVGLNQNVFSKGVFTHC